MDLEV